MKEAWHRWLLAVLLVAGLALMGWRSPLTTHADTTLGGTTCDFTDLANAVAAGGTVTFSTDCSITVTTPPGGASALIVTNTVTIDGSGHTVIFDGGRLTRPFEVDPPGNLTLRAVILRHGRGGQGGAIYNTGTTTVTNSLLNSNTGLSDSGAIFNSGTLTVISSTLSSNSSPVGGALGTYGGTTTVSDSILNFNVAADSGGGALYNDNVGTTTVTDSILSNNSTSASTASGGAIDNLGTTIVSGSTLNGNTTAGSGGAVYSTGTLEVTNSTMSSNLATSNGGAILSSGSLQVANTTLSANLGRAGGGGIFLVSGTATVMNSVAVANVPDDTEGSYSGIGNVVGRTIAGTTYTISQIVATDATGNPQLANNGGPTQTIALVPGSPAIGFGRHCVGADGSTPLVTDQRGFSRPNAPANCDAGAYEFAGGGSSGTPTATATGTATSTLTNTPVLPSSTPTIASVPPTDTPSSLPSPTATASPMASAAPLLALVVHGTRLTAKVNRSLTNVVAGSFSDTSSNTATNFRASIDWGDAPISGLAETATSAALRFANRLVPQNGFLTQLYLITGSHTYHASGTFPINVTITAADGRVAYLTSIAQVSR